MGAKDEANCTLNDEENCAATTVPRVEKHLPPSEWEKGRGGQEVLSVIPHDSWEPCVAMRGSRELRKLVCLIVLVLRAQRRLKPTQLRGVNCVRQCGVACNHRISWWWLRKLFEVASKLPAAPTSHARLDGHENMNMSMFSHGSARKSQSARQSPYRICHVIRPFVAGALWAPLRRAARQCTSEDALRERQVLLEAADELLPHL
jgi:hypothetical protein